MAVKNVCTECGYIAGLLVWPCDLSLCCHAPTTQQNLIEIPVDKRRLNPVYKKVAEEQGEKDD